MMFHNRIHLDYKIFIKTTGFRKIYPWAQYLIMDTYDIGLFFNSLQVKNQKTKTNALHIM